ncbi:MAG TPA: alpha/beta fold hydrolase [Pirellulaceae bacterium]|nr:alpha/beta fold hydrolase [Pirellulaceae bacterium]
MPLVQLADISLHVIDRGSGTPLVLVHGFPLDHTMWRGQIDGLADVCRVIAPDLRGFGRSGVTAGTVTMAQFADDLAALLDTLAVMEPVVLCGLSMGGYIAWQFALRHRRRLSKLILCDTRAIADTPDGAAGRIKTAERVLAEGSSVVAEPMLGKFFAPATVSQRPELIEETRQVILRTAPEGIAAALRGMAERPDVSGRLADFDTPALVVGGEHDVISTPSEMHDFTGKMPQARFVKISDAGHMAPLEQPAAVNQVLRAFLDFV